MSFKTIAILTAAIASAAALAQDRAHHDGGGRSYSSSHSSSSSSRGSSQSGRSYGGSQRQSYGGSYRSQSYGSRSGSYSRSQSSEGRSRSSEYPGRSSYGYDRPSSGYSHSYGAGRSYSSSRTASSPSRWRDSETRSSSSIGRRDFGEQRDSSHFTSTRTFQEGHHDSPSHWSDRYTGGSSRDDHHTGTFRNEGFGRSGSSFVHDGGRSFDRGRLGAHFDFIHQSSHWGGGWRTGWVRPAGIFFGLSFGFYLSDRFAAPCFVSPWYYYDCLPPYIPESHCIVVPDYSCNWNAGVTYDWSDGDNYGDRALDDALSEIQDAYRNQDMDAVDRLVPSYGDVAISTDGHYDYSLKADEFGQMFTDSVKGCDTVSFHVENVRKLGSYAIVRCTHDVHDSDGGMDTVYQTYRLRMQEGRYVVTDFMTEHSSEF